MAKLPSRLADRLHDPPGHRVAEVTESEAVQYVTVTDESEANTTTANTVTS